MSNSLVGLAKAGSASPAPSAATNAAEVTFLPVSARSHHPAINRQTWWDPSSTTLDYYGSGPLLYRCMREYYWSKEFAMRVLKGYRQFLELKTILEDWDAKILTPSQAVNQMWQQHMLDVINYCHDCVLICGRVVGNDPDVTALDEWAYNKAVVATKQLLRARFESEVDLDVWRFAEPAVTTGGGQSVGGDTNSRSARHHGAGYHHHHHNHPVPSQTFSGLTNDERYVNNNHGTNKYSVAGVQSRSLGGIEYDVNNYNNIHNALDDKDERDDEEAERSWVGTGADCGRYFSGHKEEKKEQEPAGDMSLLRNAAASASVANASKRSTSATTRPKAVASAVATATSAFRVPPPTAAGGTDSPVVIHETTQQDVMEDGPGVAKDRGDIEVEDDTNFGIRVRTLKGSIYTLSVNRRMAVSEVKSMIQAQHSIPSEKQHLLFYGKVLEDNKTLGELSIPPDSGLQLLVRSRKLDVSAY